jgi:hypothetical protein
MSKSLNKAASTGSIGKRKSILDDEDLDDFDSFLNKKDTPPKGHIVKQASSSLGSKRPSRNPLDISSEDEESLKKKIFSKIQQQSQVLKSGTLDNKVSMIDYQGSKTC